MSTENHLTIRDYFDQRIVMRIPKSIVSQGDVERSSENSLFQQLLEFTRLHWFKKNHQRPTGLTVADYLAHPLPAKVRYSRPQASTSSEINETHVEEFALDTNLPAKENSEGNPNRPLKPKRNPVQTSSTPVGESSRRQTDLSVRQKIEKCIQKASGKYNLPPELIKGVIRAESNFDVTAVSHAGAQGLMQLMPATAKELGLSNLFDIEQNIDGGARYLRRMLDSFGGDVRLALAAYNAGPGTVQKYGGDVPYQETKNYIDRVLRFSGQTV